ncbi:trypsin-like serine peptidase [Streptomyces sp. NPDC002870]|uniref:trypsin-like serine peptidase n=1 Tax=Streptomyces sp. NPDC002870 TaxID=3364666 RepID=UPI0036C2A369
MPPIRRTPIAARATALLLVLAGVGCDSPARLPAFSNPVVEGLWTTQRMAQARAADTPVPNGIGEDAGTTDPEPAPVSATAEKAAYHDNAAVIGKIFFDTPDGPSVCSGTAVEDPARPGRSALVWTAGHCVHAGAGGGWFRNIVFVPSYNNLGLDGTARQAADENRIAPFGTWWADWAEVAPEWVAEGAPSGGAGSPFDYAVLHVQRQWVPDSLQETIGQAAPVWFGAPSATRMGDTAVWGYPAERPFDGERMFSCQDRPGRLSIRSDQPVLYRIGCTMTGGSSGGGWFARGPSGAPALVSNTSIGPADSTWLAGPRLGEPARKLYQRVSDKAGSL